MSSLRVLLIDSDSVECARVAGQLEEAGHNVLPLHSFEEATEALDVQRFDVVLLSEHMVGKAFSRFVQTLRNSEAAGRTGSRTAILCCVRSAMEHTESSGLDGYLSPEFDMHGISHLVAHLAAQVNTAAGIEPVPNKLGALPIFLANEFEEQMGFDQNLIIEIIDLFREESVKQITEMKAALAGSDFPLLSRIAHTIKGSFGSLYARQASQHAQNLELASKAEDSAVCRSYIQLVEGDLRVLEPQLLLLRNR